MKQQSMPIDKALEDLQRLVKAARIVGRAPPYEEVRDVFGLVDDICFFCGAHEHEKEEHTKDCAWVVFREVTGG